MRIEKMIEELRKGNKMIHKTFNDFWLESLEYYEKYKEEIITCRNSKGNIYYFELSDFLERYKDKKYKQNWKMMEEENE